MQFWELWATVGEWGGHCNSEIKGEGSGGHCNSGSKLSRRNVVNILMKVLCSIFREI